MSCRGVFQLKKLHLQFCDYGGSSKGARDLLQSQALKEFVAKNPQIDFKFMTRRGTHPFVSATYVNGFIKDYPLKNYNAKEIAEYYQKARTSFGRGSISHAGKKVFSKVKSVQGGWKPNMWNTYPTHELEYFRKIPTFDKEYTSRFIDKVKENRIRNLSDNVNKLYKMKEKLNL